MNWRKTGMLLASLCLLLAATQAVQAQTACNADPAAAVQCFVKNAVNSGLATLPPGMTLSQYKAYGVAVSNIVQTPPTLVFLLGAMGAVSDALPPVNADGSPNQAAQDAAVNAMIDAALRDGLITLPPNTTVDRLKMFAHDVCMAMMQNNGVSVSPGAILRFLDSFLVSATLSDGTIDWNKVNASVSSLVDGLTSSGLLKLPAGATASSAKQFAMDVAKIIQDYKAATRKARL